MIRRRSDLYLFLAIALAALLAWGALLSFAAAVRALAQIQPGAVAASLGLPGTGKTETVKKASASWRRRVVFEPYAARDRLEYSRGLSYRQPWPGQLVSVEQLLRNPAILDAPKLALVVAPSDPAPHKMGRDFNAVARMVWRTGGIVLVGEESGLYSRHAVEWINQISSGGAHARLSLVLICQSLGRIQKDGRRNISLISAGAQGEEDDLMALRKRCGRRFADAVSKLRPALFDQRGRLVRPPDQPEVWSPGQGFDAA